MGVQLEAQLETCMHELEEVEAEYTRQVSPLMNPASGLMCMQYTVRLEGSIFLYKTDDYASTLCLDAHCNTCCFA